jgi:lipopolysaccharide transport system ATP-binding protein
LGGDSVSKSNQIILRADNICMSYRQGLNPFRSVAYQALKGISFSISRGENLGVLGRNGCGKSSLLRILAGIVEPTSGTLDFNEKHTRLLLGLGVGFDPNLSGRDNAVLSAMFQGHGKAAAEQLLPQIREFSELGDFFDRPVKTYSAGMRLRLGFSVALINEVDLLLIDEVMAVGDPHFRVKAEKAMETKLRGNHAVVFVSHNIDLVAKICTRAIWIDHGLLRAEGDVAEVGEEYRKFMNSPDSGRP